MKPFLNRIFDFFLNYKTFTFFSVLIFVLKVIYSYKTGYSGIFFEDWFIAHNIVEYGTYSLFIELGSTAYKLPIYPLFLSFFMYLFPNNCTEVIVIVQHFLFFFVPFLIIHTLKIFNRKQAGIIAGYIFIFSPAYFYYSNVYEVTNIFIPIFIFWSFVYLKIFAGQYCKKKHFILLGFATALLFLTQVIVVPLILLLLSILVLYKKVKVKFLLLTCFTAMICYSPWIIRNYEVFDRFIPSKTPVWINIYFGYTSDVNILQNLKIISKENEEQIFQKRTFTNEFVMEKIYKNEVQTAIHGRNYLPIVKGIQNAILLWTVPATYFYDYSWSILIGRKLFLLVIHTLSLVSLVYFYKKGTKFMVIAFLLVFVSFTIPYMIGHAANMRFKLDFEWLQYILVGLYVMEISTKYFSNKPIKVNHNVM